MKTDEQLIAQLMESRGINRKSAVQYLRHQTKQAEGQAIAVAEIITTTYHGSAAALEFADPVAPVDQTETIISDVPKLDALVGPAAKEWDAARAVELYKGGMKVIDIAVEMGYPRGSGCNRTKAAIVKAGVFTTV